MIPEVRACSTPLAPTSSRTYSENTGALGSIVIILAQVLTGRVSVGLNAVAFRPERLVARQATFALLTISRNRRLWALRFRQAM